ncbi:MAG: putative glycoside hydrolase [Pseudomonadota bacterium]
MTHPLQYLVATLAAFLIAWPAGTQAELRPGEGNIPFWLRLLDHGQIDARVVSVLAEDAAMVVVRTNPNNFPSLAARTHSAAPDVPLFTYSQASQYALPRKRGDRTLSSLAEAPELQVRSHKGKPLTGFGDVTNPEYRDKACEILASAVAERRADGLAIDLAVRTPRPRPRPLAQRCEAEPEFCERYAKGMDALFGQLRKSLGPAPIIYNGLWNFADGMVEDQAKLLRHADAAIVEYFGLNPLEDQQAFTQDILPYLHAMQSLPEGKRLFVYGRGPWRYTDYQVDYRWQRYLYASYLLSAGRNTYFKYHASFQVPAHAGRAGGLDTYADWKLPLGDPKGDYQIRGGVYYRAFQNGLVLVAPDDGNGGTFRLDGTMYSPEGEALRGELALSPGTAMILLEGPPPSPAQSTTISLAPLQQWQAARWVEEGEQGPYLALEEAAEGEHDLLLENERELAPAPALRLRLRPRDATAQLQIVAEVDDPKGKAERVVLVSRTGGAPDSGEKPLPQFRAPSIQRYKAPFVSGPALESGEWQELRLDAGEVSVGRFTVRGWRYLRLMGPMDVAEVSIRRVPSDE